MLSDERREAGELLESAGIEARLIEPLAAYAARVLAANRRFNLTGAKSVPEFVEHVLDSLSVAPYVREPHVDIGSGAGLPGIVVAIAAGVPVTFVESTVKKARFIEELLGAFGLAGEVAAARAEVAAHDERFRERFASGTARAVSSATTVAELLLPFLSVGGVAVMQRGSLDARERAALEDASLMLGGAVENEIAAGAERRIVLVRKHAPTPHRFPRRTGIPEKRPLCE